MLFATAFAPSLTGAKELPNIIYIVTDQQTASAMSCMGNADLHTPNMDRLAQSGVLFRNAYCSAPLSGPSRASMFTGYTSHEVGLARNNVPMADSLRTASLGWLVQNAGYECAYAGKWHVHTPSMPDKEFGFSAIYPHNDNGLAEVSVAFLDRKHSKPFFLVVGFDNPHNICEYARSQNLPFGNLPELSQDEWPGLPSNFARNPYDADVIDYEQALNYSAYPTRHYSPDDWRRYRSLYFRLVEKVDAEIGKIVDAIDRRNLWRNTVVIFTSDHGDGVGAHHWNQKSALYEEVVNVPLIVTLPGKKNAGKEMPQLINAGVDFSLPYVTGQVFPFPEACMAFLLRLWWKMRIRNRCTSLMSLLKRHLTKVLHVAGLCVPRIISMYYMIRGFIVNSFMTWKRIVARCGIWP